MRAPGWTRSAALSGTRDTVAGNRRRQAAHPQALDPAGVGVEHLEFEPVRVRDHLAALRHPPGQREDEAAEGVDLVLLALGTQPGPVMRLELFDRDAGI